MNRAIGGAPRAAARPGADVILTHPSRPRYRQRGGLHSAFAHWQGTSIGPGTHASLVAVAPIRLTLVTRQECHLCEEMAAVIDRVAPGFDAQVEVRDVDADPELLARYSDEVPVLLIDDRKAFKYRVTARELERRLRAAGAAVYLNR